MEVGQMQRQWVDYTKSLFMEGFLDGQFSIFEVVSIFFEDSEKLLNDLTFALCRKSYITFRNFCEEQNTDG
ncbi:putative signal transduction histidine kinase, phosphotransfer (Hpt) domain-containing protein [Lupinus albus]|uniref:Putative signal transduction histidine kinase, phosphotransfer (Hpt) domain-containing protein n=1 Tax=Lupinus albus TaxID=3870 RepID=A0A6A4NY00_LUPAL|nr:putative signal transduction histidine kinase, phosphotransfer (Hpt) domain-containing protein [Lupinus albus]